MSVFLILTIPAAIFLALVAWNVLAWPRVAEAASTHPGSVSVLIPARNEESNLPTCLDAALQQGVTVKEVIVCDDHSIDGTARVIRQYAAKDIRVKLLEGAALPDGWCGKNFACAQLAAAADGEWLLFLDADARLAAGAAARMIVESRTRQLTLLSCWPRLTLVGFWEKAVMPMLNFTVFTLFPAPLSLVRQDASLGLAHGACLFVHRETYHEIGGHHTVRDEIFEDTRLAQLWRAAGHRSLCLDGQDVVSVRMYGSFTEIWRGFEKNFFPAFRHGATFVTFLLLHSIVFLAPFFLIGVGGKAAAACILAMRAMLAVRFRHSLWSILLHPLAEAVLIGIGLSSWWRCRSGKGVIWKDRVYHSDERSTVSETNKAGEV